MVKHEGIRDDRRSSEQEPYSHKESMSVEDARNESFQKQLLLWALRNKPELVDAVVFEQRTLWEELEAREWAIHEIGLQELLSLHGINTVIVESEDRDYYSMVVADTSFLPEQLPSKYAYKGGVARVALQRALGLTKSETPRDIDLVRLGASGYGSEEDAKLAKRLMHDDYATGYGVERVSSLEDYFSNRDFTVNEVIVADGIIFATREAILDTIRHIVRLTSYEKKRYDGRDSSLNLAKLLRHMVRGVRQFGEWSDTDGDSQMIVEKTFFPPFSIAVHLDRAMEVSQGTAQDYVDSLRSYRKIPDELRTVTEVYEYLKTSLSDSNFHFRYAPESQFELEDELAERYRIKNYNG